VSCAALHEAQDINLHLKPLRSHIEDIEQAEFDEAIKFIAPMMHVTCLVWANSKYYCTPARIIVLLQEICNLFIHQVRYILSFRLFHGTLVYRLTTVIVLVSVASSHYLGLLLIG